MQESTPGKISVGEKGLGTPTPEMVEERALAIARSDGRSEANDLDRECACDELTGKAALADIGEEDKNPRSPWNAPVVSTGEKAPVKGPVDEANISEMLIEQGIEEADRDQRGAAAEENPPEE